MYAYGTSKLILDSNINKNKNLFKYITGCRCVCDEVLAMFFFSRI